MGQEFFDGVEIAGQFTLGEQAVNLAVANGVQDGDGAVLPAFHFRREMVPAFEGGGNLPAAERTDTPGMIWSGFRHLNLISLFHTLPDMKSSTVLTIATALTLFVAMTLTSCITCERCARKRAAAAAAAAGTAPAPVPQAPAPAGQTAW